MKPTESIRALTPVNLLVVNVINAIEAAMLPPSLAN